MQQVHELGLGDNGDDRPGSSAAKRSARVLPASRRGLVVTLSAFAHAEFCGFFRASPDRGVRSITSPGRRSGL